MASLAATTSRRSLPSPLYSEIHRYFSTLRPPARQIHTRALERACGGILGPKRRAEAAVAGDGAATSRSRESLWGEGERWARARALRGREYSSCSAPGCPNNPTGDASSNGSSSSAATRPSSPSSASSSDPHALAKIQPHPLTTSTPHPAYLSSLPKSLRRVAASLPTAHGRPPSRDQLLALTSSFFERLKIRFKWATIRSYRRFRVDDWSAFFSVGILGTLGWFLLKTTSAFAVVFFLVNSLSSQEWLAAKLGAYLTQSTGVKVVFESAIVPKWGIFGEGGSKIVFKNVYISRGPVKGELGVLPVLGDEGGEEETEEEARLREMVAQWTHFHLSIDTVEVSLSLRRWLDGKGLVENASVRGVRGVVERSHIVYDPDAPRDRFAYRHKPRPGDFWLESLQIEDFLVTIYQPENFRPVRRPSPSPPSRSATTTDWRRRDEQYTFSIFNADIRRLRKQWLFYDLMSAESITGQVDNCLFSLHKPQSIGRTSDDELKDARWSRMVRPLRSLPLLSAERLPDLGYVQSRFRVDGVPIDHMQSQSDTGVLSWLTSGRYDLVADIRFPREESELDLSTLVADLVDDLADRLPGQRSLSREALEAPWSSEGEGAQKEERKRALRFAKETAKEEGEEVHHEDDEEDKIVSIDLDIRFKDLKASVPVRPHPPYVLLVPPRLTWLSWEQYFTSNFSYINNALIRPIVAFINRNRTLIPIRCHIDLGLSEFNGSWTTYDVGILDRITAEREMEALTAGGCCSIDSIVAGLRRARIPRPAQPRATPPERRALDPPDDGQRRAQHVQEQLRVLLRRTGRARRRITTRVERAFERFLAV
ncbi:SPOSA6832_00808, partial [Sporobolomyces salmonicolor]